MTKMLTCHVNFAGEPPTPTGPETRYLPGTNRPGTALGRRHHDERPQRQHFRLPVNLIAVFKKTTSILGLSEAEAAEIALRKWVQRNRDEAQKRLEMYAEKGIVIHEPESVTVNVTVFQKAELLVAKEELQRVLGVLPDIQDPASRHNWNWHGRSR